MTNIRTLFEQEITRRGLTAELKDDGRYEVSLNGGTYVINLENIERKAGDEAENEAQLRSFLDSALEALAPLPPWEEAKHGIRFCAEPSDYEFGDTLNVQISDSLCRVLEWIDRDETRITWLSPSHLAQWQQPLEIVEAVAEQNMKELLREGQLHVEHIEPHKLGMFKTDSVFKASLIFAPNLKEEVGDKLGWPLLAVVPCRDFIYLLSRDDAALLGSIGPIVVREFSEQGYPVSTEVFQIDDSGISAIGNFHASTSVEEPAEGMKVIRYRGGVVVFCIPDTWEEEYGDDGGGTFYEDEPDSGTLRLNIITIETASTLGPDAAIHLLQPRAVETECEIETMPGENALIMYSVAAAEDDLWIWYWEVANPVPPNHARIAIFSYSVPADRKSDVEVLEEVDMIDREIRKCMFAASLGS